MNLIVFDIDGTLIDSNQVDHECMIKAVGKVLGKKVELDMKFVQNAEFQTDTQLVMDLWMHHKGRYPRTFELNQIKKELISCFEIERSSSGDLHEIPGARKLFTDLKNHPDFAVAIATGSWKVSAEYKLDSCDIRWRYIPLITSDKLRSKYEILSECRNHSRVYYNKSNFKSEVYFGDKDWDQSAAEKLRMKFIKVDKNLKTNTLSALNSLPTIEKLIPLLEV